MQNVFIKKIYLYWDLAHTLCILIHTKWVSGEIDPERRLEGQQITKLSRKYQHHCLYLQSINCDEHLSQSPFTDQFFK
jgi:hypothetical protein